MRERIIEVCWARTSETHSCIRMIVFFSSKESEPYPQIKLLRSKRIMQDALRFNMADPNGRSPNAKTFLFAAISTSRVGQAIGHYDDVHLPISRTCPLQQDLLNSKSIFEA